MDGIKNYLTDMDGVILQGSTLLPGAQEFVHRLRVREIPYLILTNNSRFTQRDLQMRLSYMGLDVPSRAIFTSALATAQFLHDQQPGGRAFVIGESGLTTALHDIGYILTDQEPEYVVLGETTSYSFQHITQAIRLINIMPSTVNVGSRIARVSWNSASDRIANGRCSRSATSR